MRWASPSPQRNSLAAHAGLTLAVFAVAWLGIEFTRESGRIASVWLANGVVLLAFLRTSRKRWPGWLLCGLVGNLTANLAHGDVSGLATSLSLCNTLEVILVGGLYRFLVPEPRPDLARFRPLLLFILVGGVLGPAASAAVAATLLHHQLALPFVTVFRTWFSADSLGLLITVPLFAGTAWPECRKFLKAPSAPGFLATLVLVPVTTSLILHGHAPWLFLLSPLFLWAAFRYGFAGIAAAIFLATASGVATLTAEFHAGQLHDLRADIAFLQTFLFMNVLVFLPVASLLNALRESENQFRLLFDRAPIGMAIVDSRSGRFLSVNPRLGEIVGHQPGDLMKQGFTEITHPEHVEDDLASVRRLAAGEVEEVSKEKRYLHRSGRIVWGRLRMVRLPSSPGAPRHLALVEDITAANLAQAEKLEALDRLQKVAKRVPGMVYQYRVRPDGAACIPYTSDAIWDLYRVRPEEVREDLSKLNARHHPEDHAGIVASIMASAAHLTPWKHDFRVRFEDGTVRHLFGDAVPVREEDGSILWTGFITDVTERKQLETSFLQAQKMESLGVLAGGVAHDMNNVLAAILALSSAHLTIQEKDSLTYQAFDTIREAATRGGTMVKSLLNFARQRPSEKRELDCNALVLEAARLLEHTTLSRIRLELRLEPGLGRIHGDGSALSHALMNLCVNAVDAMQENGTLTLSTRNDGAAWIEVTVEDTGTGMTREVLDRAMDPFFTTKEIGKGTGLGLSMVYAAVKAHEGRLDLRSEPGRGTTVSLRFPRSAPGAPDRAEDAAPVPGASRPLDVLLVDDDDLILRSTRMLVELLGHTVSAVPSGEEALALLEGGLRPDVVILDMNMPGLGGKGTLPRLRRLCPALPVLLATGRADQAALDLVAAHTGVHLLPKPFSLQDLQMELKGLAPGA